MVETLKESRNILLGHGIDVFTDHKNINDETIDSASQRVQFWNSLIEQFGVTIVYIKIEAKVVAYNFSLLPIAHHAHKLSDTTLKQKPMHFCVWNSYSFMITQTISPSTQRRFHFRYLLILWMQNRSWNSNMSQVPISGPISIRLIPIGSTIWSKVSTSYIITI